MQAQAERDGVPDDWLEHARRSPVHALAFRYRVALPLHPEHRTLPMVWYVPPLSPVVNALERDGYEAGPEQVFPAVEKMRIPVQYLANLLAAGDADVIRGVLGRLAAMRAFMRERQVRKEEDPDAAAAVGMESADLEAMYRLLAIAKYEDRYVIPQAHMELAQRLPEQPGTCGLDFEGGPGNCGASPRPAESVNQRFMLTDRFQPARPGLRLPAHGGGLVPRHLLAPAQHLVDGLGSDHLPGPRHRRLVPLALWPFSRLVHAWSLPAQYLGRPYILYRSPVRGGQEMSP